jgi:predicted RNase H-like HicB family nuclease
MATVHVPYTAGQDQDGVWCAHARLGSSGGANGHGATVEDAVADLREAVRMVLEEDGVPGAAGAIYRPTQGETFR